jgi:hypothetical protein
MIARFWHWIAAISLGSFIVGLVVGVKIHVALGIAAYFVTNMIGTAVLLLLAIKETNDDR